MLFPNSGLEASPAIIQIIYFQEFSSETICLAPWQDQKKVLVRAVMLGLFEMYPSWSAD